MQINRAVANQNPLRTKENLLGADYSKFGITEGISKVLPADKS